MTSSDPLRARAEQIASEHQDADYCLDVKTLSDAIYAALSEVAQEREPCVTNTDPPVALFTLAQAVRHAEHLDRLVNERNAQLASLTASHERAIKALEKYGRHEDSCTRKRMQGRCSCGFSRLFDIESPQSPLTLDGGASQA